MSFSSRVAHFVTHRRRTLCAGLALLLLACAGLIACFWHLDSEVLNLLPGGFESVHALKTFNRDFSQNRELTFAIFDENPDAPIEDFTDHFATMLRKEPWVLRVMDHSPMESPDGMAEVQTLGLPLLLNLAPADFDAAVSLLEPEKMQARLHKLRGEIESGSMRAEMELNFDPLGLVTRALKPLAGSFSVEQTQPLVSKDSTLHHVLVITDQKGLGPRDCQAMMAKVADFKTRVLASWQGEKKAPQILVTGRTPYVAEMSKSMEGDITSTMLGSVLLVGGVFYIGFRRLRPLLAIMHVLLLCCIVAISAGFVIFHTDGLNGITIGFCSILVGLGVDFGMLLYGSYQTERHNGKDHEAAVAAAIRQLGKGIFFGALTTAAGFLALILSGCGGFAQLGVLIAIGILLAAVFMMTLFFVFMGPKHLPREHDWLFDLTKKYVAAVFRSPRPVFFGTGILLLLLNIVAFVQIGKIRFQADPKSLEPKDSKAGFALRTISAKMTAGGVEPVLVILEAKSAEEFHDYWARAQARWTEMRDRGAIKNFNSPFAFAVSPELVKANTTKLAKIDFKAARESLAKIIAAEGFNADSFKNSFAFIDSLEKLARGDTGLLDWRKSLPENSSWWFVLDKFFGTEPNVGAAYITPNKTITSESEKEALRIALETPGVPVQISGWSYTLANLIPWSKSKLMELSVVMILFNIVLLIFLYRKFFPLLILMLSLFLSIGAMVATLIVFAIPLNLFNVLAFPLVLGVGVDYGIYVLLAVRQPGNRELAFATILKPVLLSGLTGICGFGSLAFAHNPSLRGLGIVCSVGTAWCLFATLFFILPAYVWKGDR
jgi:predicted RND superfamily exporter protein